MDAMLSFFKTEMSNCRTHTLQHTILWQLLKTGLQCKPTCWCSPLLCVSSNMTETSSINVPK